MKIKRITMSTSAEKLVKQTIKLLSKTQELDYEELKMDAKKIIKAARVFDETLLGMMEEIMDLGNVGSQEELEEFNPEVLKIYCRIKEIDDSGSDKSLRARVWGNIEDEFEIESDSEDESVVESENDEPESEPEPEPVKVKKSSRKPKPDAEVVIIG
jgi:hypothetical protein